MELGIGFDPFNPYDVNGDWDGDRLTNIFEYEHGLNMREYDTDHDGINDIMEYR